MRQPSPLRPQVVTSLTRASWGPRAPVATLPPPGPRHCVRDRQRARVQGFKPPRPHSHRVECVGPGWARRAEGRRGYPSPCAPAGFPAGRCSSFFTISVLRKKLTPHS